MRKKISENRKRNIKQNQSSKKKSKGKWCENDGKGPLEIATCTQFFFSSSLYSSFQIIRKFRWALIVERRPTKIAMERTMNGKFNGTFLSDIFIFILCFLCFALILDIFILPFWWFFFLETFTFFFACRCCPLSPTFMNGSFKISFTLFSARFYRYRECRSKKIKKSVLDSFLQHKPHRCPNKKRNNHFKM